MPAPTSQRSRRQHRSRPAQDAGGGSGLESHRSCQLSPRKSGAEFEVHSAPMGLRRKHLSRKFRLHKRVLNTAKNGKWLLTIAFIPLDVGGSKSEGT